MTTKVQILVLAVFGNLGLATIFLLLNLNQLADQEKAYLEDAASVYQQAWNAAASRLYKDSLGPWHPITGEPTKAAVWTQNSGSELFTPNLNPQSGENPLFEAMVVTDLADDQTALPLLLNGLFDQELSQGILSFVSYIPADSGQGYCNLGADGLAFNPCDAVLSDYTARADAQLPEVGSGQPVGVVAHLDLLPVASAKQGERAAMFQLLYLDFFAAGEPLGTLVLGKNLRPMMQFYEAEFDVSLAIQYRGELLATGQWLGSDSIAKGIREVDISQQLYSLLAENQAVLTTQSRFGLTDHSLDASIFGFPANQSPRGQQSWFLVLRDQRAALQQNQEVMQSRLITGAILFAVILIAMVGLINYAFNGIAKAISVLQALIKGDDSVSIDQGSHWLRSEDDEVALLSEALEAYRSHLIEMEDNKLYQQYNRQQRDAILMDKMRLLADQLDGEAKRLILSDVAKMQHIANSRPKEGSEDASVELMSVAFSRMSEEVVTLLDARTQEMQQAYEQASTANREIQSSINYAAKLQRALLKAERFPEDINIDVTWQPRDVVGGDIYVVRTIGSKTIIAVIDCTGHGVPGAFTSVIVRAVIDRAIEDDSITSAGSYLSKSNHLIKDMLFQHGAQAKDSDAGFDGTVCILDRDADKLEFAGANSSLFMVNNGKIIELKGDRKSVGARRTKGSYEFATQVVARPSGMFVMLTDGVTDVMNDLPRPIAFGRKRLMTLMETLDTKDPKVLTSGIMEAVDRYRGNGELRDDLTLLAFYIDQLNQPSRPSSLKLDPEVELNY